jgi:hypothetical protein
MAKMITFSFTGNEDQLRNFKNNAKNMSKVLTEFIINFKSLESTKTSVIGAQIELIKKQIYLNNEQNKYLNEDLEKLNLQFIDAKSEDLDQNLAEKQLYISEMYDIYKKTGRLVDMKLEAEQKGFASVEDYFGSWFDNLKKSGG